MSLLWSTQYSFSETEMLKAVICVSIAVQYEFRRYVVLRVGGLALAVEGPSKAEIQCVDNKDGTCTVTYMPTVPGEYSIIIKFADKNISGAPFTAKISPPGTVTGFQWSGKKSGKIYFMLKVRKRLGKIKIFSQGEGSSGSSFWVRESWRSREKR